MTYIQLEGTRERDGLRGVVMGMTPQEVTVAFPDLSGIPSSYSSGRALLVKFWSHLGIHHAKSVIVRTGGLGTHPGMVIQRFGSFETVQQRRYFRVVTSLQAAFAVLKSAYQEAQGRKDVRAATRDISAGGMSFETSLRLAPGDLVRITVTPPKMAQKLFPNPLEADAKVVRAGDTEKGAKNLYGIGVEYLFTVEAERDRWVQFTFELQRGLRL